MPNRCACSNNSGVVNEVEPKRVRRSKGEYFTLFTFKNIPDVVLADLNIIGVLATKDCVKIPGLFHLVISETGDLDVGLFGIGRMDEKEQQNSFSCLLVFGGTVKTKKSIILNHNPFLCYGGSYRDVWQLFGHVHSGPLSHTGLDLPRLKMLFPLQYDVGVDNNDFRPVSFAEVKARIEAQVESAREASGLKDIRGTGSGRRIVFLDPSIAPASSVQKTAFKRLEAVASDIIEISVSKGVSLKEAIGKRVALLSGNVRYVYVGTQPLEDFRCVMMDKSTGITEGNIDTAIQILK